MTERSPQEKYAFRKARVRRKVFGTPERPRFSIFLSSKRIYGQIIDDTQGKTLVSHSSIKEKVGATVEIAKKVGSELGDKAKTLKIQKIVFDRGGYRYHGRIKAMAEGARKAGLQF